jgi:hypothetical protein
MKQPVKPSTRQKRCGIPLRQANPSDPKKYEDDTWHLTSATLPVLEKQLGEIDRRYQLKRA